MHWWWSEMIEKLLLNILLLIFSNSSFTEFLNDIYNFRSIWFSKMWGRGYQGFNNDPFFQSHNDAFRNMFNHDPFGQFGFSQNMPAIGGPAPNNRVATRNDEMFRDPFAHMNRMMQEMSRGFGGGMMMPDLSQMQGNGHGQSYAYSSVMSYNNNGSGEPQFFEATSSSRQGPGGVKETRKTLRDSESGVNKMAIGHHINDRGHVIERSMNRRTNERDESQNFINMDESEADRFNQEWSQATHNYRDVPGRAIDDGRRRNRNGNNGDRSIKYWALYSLEISPNSAPM